MEKYFSIPTLDGYEINGVLNWKEKSKKLIIFCHGLTGSINEAQYICAKNYFAERGYDVVRFYFYTDGENTRKLKNTSIYHHSEDIKSILKHFENDYKNIFLIGHSLAGPSIVKISQFPHNLEKIIFWAPAFDTISTAKKCKIEGKKIIRSSSGKDVEIYMGMYEEFIENNHLENLSKISFSKNNMCIVYAEKDIHNNTVPIIDIMGIKYIIINGANHGFTQEGKFEELFEKTLGFIERK